MKFIGRKKELEKLNNLIDTDKFQAGLIYGRRRVGKSELVKQVIQKSHYKTVYYECKKTSEQANVKNLNMIFTEVLGVPPLREDSIEGFFEYIFRNEIKEKIIIVIDEYPYLRECVQGCDSILQSLIDNYKDTLNVTLLLLGSYVDTMKELLKKENPLYGRFDYVLDLKPMDYFDSSKFYPSLSDEDKVRIYSVFGGIPYYNQYIDDSKSVKENIIELIAAEDARLVNEIPDYLEREIGKITNANEVFDALSSGNVKYNDILEASHVSSSPALADTLNKLIKMDLVEKISPINDPNNKKKTTYRIKDNLCLFYYRYIFRFASQMSILNANTFYENYIKNDFEEQFVPNRFEAICKEYLIRENKNGNIEPFFFEIGKYYYDLPKEHKNGEFDIVTKDENGYIFYEVKFKNKPLHDEDIQKEIEQVNACGLNCYKYGFISRSGFENKNRKNVIYIELKKLFKGK